MRDAACADVRWVERDVAQDIIERYFAAFNARDRAAMLALVAEDLEHHVNQGGVRHGRAEFGTFLEEMDRAYAEEVRDLVVFTAPTQGRAAAEFMIHGTYLETQEGLPPARGQTYALPVGSFLALRSGQITRVTTYYNLADWMAQVTR